MTARAQLESEREALADVLSRVAMTAARCESALCFTPAAQANRDRLAKQHGAEAAALTASIARVEALLSLSDEQCAEVAGALNYRNNSHVPNASAYRTVAEIVRRS